LVPCARALGSAPPRLGGGPAGPPPARWGGAHAPRRGRGRFWRRLGFAAEGEHPDRVDVGLLGSGLAPASCRRLKIAGTQLGGIPLALSLARTRWPHVPLLLSCSCLLLAALGCALPGGPARSPFPPGSELRLAVDIMDQFTHLERPDVLILV